MEKSTDTKIRKFLRYCRYIVLVCVVLYFFCHWKTVDLEKEKLQKDGIRDQHLVDEEATNSTILSNRKVVFILAYMRTGSTLLSYTLQNNPGTFFVFEPVGIFMRAFKNFGFEGKDNMTVKYKAINGMERTYKTKEEALRDEMVNWLTCRLDALSTYSLTFPSHHSSTVLMKKFNNCVQKPLQKYHKTNEWKERKNLQEFPEIEKCLQVSISDCQKAPLFLMKFISMKMVDILQFIPMFPNMKILHLVRDPRGIYNSRMKIHVVKRKVLNDRVKHHCLVLANNIQVSKQILQQYQSMLKIVYYEDVAAKPLESFRSISHFLGLPFDQTRQDFIKKHTNAKSDGCAHCISRSNSSLTAVKCRMKLDYESAELIYNACKESNTVLGYLPLNNTSLNDTVIPSRKLVDSSLSLLRKRI